MSFLSGPSLPPVAPPPPKPEVTPEDKAKLQAELKDKTRKTRGRQSTLVTGGLGVQGAATVQKTRLGGV